MTTSDPRTGPAKAALRRAAFIARADRTAAARADAGLDLRDQVLRLAEVCAASAVAAYVATPAEPDPALVVQALDTRAVEVLLPVLLDDFDLDWARYRKGAWRTGRHGLVEPDGPRLGADAVGRCAVVLCPGVAGDLDGRRLGRGGGSYDRVLARLPSSVVRCLLLYDDEVVERVPAEPHDQPVHVIVTPSRVLRVRHG